MDPSTPTTAASSAVTAAPPSSDGLQPAQSQQLTQPASSLMTSPATAPPSTPVLPHTPSSNPMASQPPAAPPQSRPLNLSRPPWQTQPPHPLPPSTQGSPAQRGGIAIGVPAPPQGSPSPQPAPFASSFLGQPYAGLGRGTVSAPETSSTPSSSQLRPSSMQGVHGTGMLGSGSQLRPGGIHQQRPPQLSSLRPSLSSTSQSPSSQGFPGHGLLRGSSLGSSPSPSPSIPQGTQPWLSSSSQGKPPVPTPSFRPPVNSPSPLQQRPSIPQQQNSSFSASSTQQQQMSSSQSQKLSQLSQSHEKYGLLQPRPQPSLPPPPTPRVGPPVSLKPSTLPQGQAQPKAALSNTYAKTVDPEDVDTSGRIISKRSISELLNQIDPSEKLDPEVEDVLMDIAEDFVESITTFGCSLAKHRKSSTLEAKDILLHLEKNWNMTLPGFGGDEVKSFKKPVTDDAHRQRLAVIKKSMAVTEASNFRNATGQVAGSAKANLSKTSANILGSPNMKS